MKPRVILDIGFLGHAFEEKSAKRGVQRVVGHLFEGLAESGEVDLSFVATSHLAGAYDFLQSRGVSPDKKLHHLPAQLARSRAGGKIRKEILQTMEDRSWPARIKRRLMAARVSRELKHEPDILSGWLDQADIYHSPHPPFSNTVQAHPRIKKFLTCHDFIPLKNPEYFSNAAGPFMAGVLASLQPQNFAFCVSEATRDDVLNYSKMPPERVFVTPLAANPEMFYPVADPEKLTEVRRLFNLGNSPYFLALSAPDRHKNFCHLIECFGELVEAGEVTGYNLVIAGPNPARSVEVQAAIARYPKLKDRIIIPGFIPDDQLAAIYSGAAAFLFPSLAEGFGIPPLEAMQCGVPVLASNTTSIPEVVGDAGILLAPTDRPAWRQAIVNVAGDESLRRDLAARSLLRAKRFSWVRFIEETLRGYRKSLEM